MASASMASICFCRCRTSDIDSTDDDLKRLADSIAKRNLVVGSLVAPVWPPTGGGSAMGSEEERKAVSDPGEEGLRHRQEAARAWHSPLRGDSHRFRCLAGGLGQGSRGQHQAHRADVSRGLHHRGRLRGAARRRGRDLLGWHA